jgi:hypothetical protein
MNSIDNLKSGCMASSSMEDGSCEEADPYLYYPLGQKIIDHVQSDNSLQMLKWINLTASALFLVQLVVYAALYLPADVYPSAGKPVCCEDTFCSGETVTLGKFNIRFVFPVIIALAYLNHTLFFTQVLLRGSKVGEWLFVYNTNPIRWIEYSLSYPLATVTVAVLVGVEDVHLWLSIFLSTAVGTGLGQVIALLPRLERPDIWPLSFRFLRGLLFAHMLVALLAPWAVLLCYYVQAASSNLPGSMHAAFWAVFLSTLAVAANVLLHDLMRGYGVVTSELVFMNVSAVAKTVLCASVYIGLTA